MSPMISVRMWSNHKKNKMLLTLVIEKMREGVEAVDVPRAKAGPFVAIIDIFEGWVFASSPGCIVSSRGEVRGFERRARQDEQEKNMCFRARE